MQDKKETARLEAFSDGVFAIAITLLVLEIKVPELSSVHSVNDLWRELFHLWPSYFAFVYSFGTILIMWLNHHHMFNMITKTTARFMYANGFLLLTITLIPFLTALLAQYITTDYNKPAVVFFCFGNVLNSVAFLICNYTFLTPVRLLDKALDPKKIASSLRATWMGTFIYAGTTLLAFWLPITALIINSSLWVLWITLSLRNYYGDK
ncbi:MAG: hypothetical protein JWO92_832 [Chitinophagaceae bacterium]|nr:hypothetical protein [Chitinophagaceae bacterium]